MTQLDLFHGQVFTYDQLQEEIGVRMLMKRQVDKWALDRHLIKFRLECDNIIVDYELNPHYRLGGPNDRHTFAYDRKVVWRKEFDSGI